MAISIDEATQVVTVAQSDLTPVSGALYDFDTNAYRLSVGALLDDERYIWMDPAFAHNGEVVVAGVTYARTIEHVNGYSLTLENLTMSVRYTGSNNNLFDVENGILNPSGNVTVIAQNSAGLVVVESSAVAVAEQAIVPSFSYDGSTAVADFNLQRAGQTVVDGTSTASFTLFDTGNDPVYSSGALTPDGAGYFTHTRVQSIGAGNYRLSVSVTDTNGTVVQSVPIVIVA